MFNFLICGVLLESNKNESKNFNDKSDGKKSIFRITKSEIIWIGAFVLISLSIFIIFMTTIMPWYRFEFEEDIQADWGGDKGIGWAEYSIYEEAYEMDYEDEGSYTTFSWEDLVYENTELVFDILNILLVVGMLLLIISLLSNTLFIYKKIQLKSAMFVTIFTFLFLLMVPIFFAITLPVALEKDVFIEKNDSALSGFKYSNFYGSDSGFYTEGSKSIEYSTNWAPATGWFNIFIPIIFQFFVVVLLFVNKKLLFNSNQKCIENDLHIKKKSY